MAPQCQSPSCRRAWRSVRSGTASRSYSFHSTASFSPQLGPRTTYQTLPRPNRPNRPDRASFNLSERRMSNLPPRLPSPLPLVHRSITSCTPFALPDQSQTLRSQRRRLLRPNSCSHRRDAQQLSFPHSTISLPNLLYRQDSPCSTKSSTPRTSRTHMRSARRRFPGTIRGSDSTSSPRLP